MCTGLVLVGQHEVQLHGLRIAQLLHDRRSIVTPRGRCKPRPLVKDGGRP